MSQKILSSVTIYKLNQVVKSTVLKHPTKLSKSLHRLQDIRGLSTKILTPSVTFTTNGSTRDLQSRPDLSTYSTEGRPLTILLCWLMAKNKVVQKYTQFYLDQDYDVLTIKITPWQILQPACVDPVVRNEILPTLLTSNHQKKLIHAFSVGGYIYARLLKQMENDPSCADFKETVQGQIWDSVADLNGFSKGVSKSLFTKNEWLQQQGQHYMDWHLKVFYNVATKYFEEAHDYYYYKPLNSPALFLISEVDPISTLDVFNEIQKEWVKLGINCRSKIWTDSGHVGHMKAHPEEYKLAVTNFLGSIGMKSKQPILLPQMPALQQRVEIPGGYPYAVYSKAL